MYAQAWTAELSVDPPQVGRHIIGREAQLDRLRGVVDGAAASSQALLVLGQAGTGKTVLLADATAGARSAGLRVLSVTGRESEANLAFAGLRQLLRPVLGKAASLPGVQGPALLGALGLAEDPGATDQLSIGIAVLTLLSDLSEDRALAVIIDDAQWLDRSSLDALAFAARRLDGERVVILVGARGNSPAVGLDWGLPELTLGPLRESDAGRLLDVQPSPPRGRTRARVLAEAAGNPMALIELAKVIAADPAAGRRWTTEPLPLTDRLTEAIATQAAALPEATLAALLLAAVTDSSDPAVIAGGLALDQGALAPAERLGLIRMDSRAGVQFAHPLIRSAIYHSVPPARRAAAHRDLAETLHSYPDRRAWHLAAAAAAPDEQVAALLEDTAADARRRGGASAAAAALERAAELSPDRAQQARRLASAAEIASFTGQADWVKDLATRALAVTADLGTRIHARELVGKAMVWSSEHDDAIATLIEVAKEAAGYDVAIAWDALAHAATGVYQSGTPAGVQAVLDTLALLERTAQPAMTGGQLLEEDVAAMRMWILASTGPYRDTSGLLRHLDHATVTDLPAHVLAWAGSAAWLIDQTDQAIELLQATRLRMQAPGVRGASGGVLSSLGWAYLDAGHWDEALAAAAEADSLADAYALDIVAASAALITASVLAARGEVAAARPQAARALASDPVESRSVVARARHALGVAALAEGSDVAAYTQLRRLFDESGAPLHYHVCFLAVADFAAAAVRAGQAVEGLEVVRGAVDRLDGVPSPRLEQLLGRAHGLLAESAEAEKHYSTALADPAGDQWPFERAQLRLDYGAWLRRQRRVKEAKLVLTAARDTFGLLRAQPGERQAEAELRACGVAVAGQADVLAELTPQQRQIVYLAGSGLTNREIGDRLFLSPRTVSSHLYVCYPKLGIASRHQLRDLIPQLARWQAGGLDESA
jgi:DNA-binding CsgD family transcriptional regulator/tetratricopeptide (TPR) repeat protein